VEAVMVGGLLRCGVSAESDRSWQQQQRGDRKVLAASSE